MTYGCYAVKIRRKGNKRYGIKCAVGSSPSRDDRIEMRDITKKEAEKRASKWNESHRRCMATEYG